VQDEFGIGTGAEIGALRLQRRRIGLPAIHFAVVAQPQGAVRVAHRLAGFRARVDDGEARMQQGMAGGA
jgi:hypothetical protein